MAVIVDSNSEETEEWKNASSCSCYCCCCSNSKSGKKVKTSDLATPLQCSTSQVVNSETLQPWYDHVGNMPN